MNEFRPGDDGWGGSVEAYQSDLRAILTRIQALEEKLVAVQGAQVAGGQAGGSVASVSSQAAAPVATTLPHTHVLADVTDLSSLSVTTSQVTGLLEFIQDAVGAMLVAGLGVTVTYDDGAGTVTITAP